MSDPLAGTGAGELRGRREGDLSVFRGIPFAEPPVGERRFRAPQPAQGWNGVRDAGAFGASAMQAPAGELGEMIGIAAGPIDEDCLYLNVWTPACDDAARPVMVWIHGGGNTVGSGAQPRINGEFLARRGDVVVVTLNYRLGAFGFLYCPEHGGTGNEGLLDQVLALRWVRAEIAAFGGDPANVTVFGQSAGGFDIAQLMALPAAEGCFDRMVPMSGSLRPPVLRQESTAVAARLADRLGGDAKLATAPAADLLAAQVAVASEGVTFGPVADGAVIAHDPVARIGAGQWTRGLPLMIGHCTHEWSLWTGLSARLQKLEADGLHRLARGVLGDHVDAGLAVYREVWPHVLPVHIWSAIMTDAMFRMPAIQTAELHGQHTPDVWFYRFDWCSPARDEMLGACHSLDIPFVFGTCHTEPMPRFCGVGPRVERLTAQVMDAYLAFARSGNPGHPGLPDWQRYEPGARTTMRLDEQCSTFDDQDDNIRDFWFTTMGMTGGMTGA